LKKDLVTWALAAVPLVGLVELALHWKQTGLDRVPMTDWEQARESLRPEVTGTDLVLFAPFWADPIGRSVFGDALAGREREARADESAFARVFEVGIRGAHRDEIAGWPKVAERKLGAVTVGIYTNPVPVQVHTRWVEHVSPSQMTVVLVQNGVEQPCVWTHGVGQPGGLSVPQGPAVPGDRFVCGRGSYVGLAVLHDADHRPRACLFATPPAAGAQLRLRLRDVSFGTSLHGHTGVQWRTERTPTHDVIGLAFSAFGRPLGTREHRVGAGWTRFEFPTSEFAGRTGELVADITGPGPGEYCFEVDTRSAAR